ncbi:helix-turn-helix domain-containing protein [Brachybacterium alimentarium]|uniref:helix-turn-helix domain-containing protein n=1 Tax=Brachybacterium alimentarium TaxID=47845 RepID=UPI003FD3DABC
MDSQGTEPRGAIEEANFIANMAKLRKAQGWSQGELAKRMQDAGWSKFHQTTISRIEQGVQAVRLGEARGIADALGTLVGPMLLNDEVSEKWWELDEATRKLRDLGSGIGAGVVEYLWQQVILRDLLTQQPDLTDDVHPATVENRERAIELAKALLARTYADYIDDAMKADGLVDEGE